MVKSILIVVILIGVKSLHAQSDILQTAVQQKEVNIYEALFNLGIDTNAEIIDIGLPYNQLELSPQTLDRFSQNVADIFPKSIRYQRLQEAKHLLKLSNQNNLFDAQLMQILDFSADASIRYEIVSNTYANAILRVLMSNANGQTYVISDFTIKKNPKHEYPELYRHYISLFASDLNNMKIEFDESLSDIDAKNCRKFYEKWEPQKLYTRSLALNNALSEKNATTGQTESVTRPITFSKRGQEASFGANNFPIWISIAQETDVRVPSLKTYLSELCLLSLDGAVDQDQRFASDPDFQVKISDPIQSYNSSFVIIGSSTERCMPTLLTLHNDILYFIMFPFDRYTNRNLNTSAVLKHSLIGRVNDEGTATNLRHGSGLVLRHAPPQNIGTLFFKCFKTEDRASILDYLIEQRDSGFKSWIKLSYSTIN